MGAGSWLVLGLRCSNADYSFAVLDGSKSHPRIVEKGSVRFPHTYSRARQMGWFKQEIEDRRKHHSISALAIKGAEGIASRGKAFVERIENEAAAILAAVARGIGKVPRKTKSTIAKDLGLKGRAGYLATALDTSVIAGFNDLPVKEQEAVLVAWSELH